MGAERRHRLMIVLAATREEQQAAGDGLDDGAALQRRDVVGRAMEHICKPGLATDQCAPARARQIQQRREHVVAILKVIGMYVRPVARVQLLLGECF